MARGVSQDFTQRYMIPLGSVCASLGPGRPSCLSLGAPLPHPQLEPTTIEALGYQVLPSAWPVGLVPPLTAPCSFSASPPESSCTRPDTHRCAGLSSTYCMEMGGQTWNSGPCPARCQAMLTCSQQDVGPTGTSSGSAQLAPSGRPERPYSSLSPRFPCSVSLGVLRADSPGSSSTGSWLWVSGPHLPSFPKDTSLGMRTHPDPG